MSCTSPCCGCRCPKDFKQRCTCKDADLHFCKPCTESIEKNRFNLASLRRRLQRAKDSLAEAERLMAPRTVRAAFKKVVVSLERRIEALEQARG